MMFEFDFVLKALIAGVGIALVAGPLGSVMVWRRMAYFGETLAHAMLLGVGFALLFKLPLSVGMVSIALLIAGLLALLSRRKTLSDDALLGIFAHTTLALGLIMTTILPNARLNLLSYLYGNILAVQAQSLILIGLVDIFVITVLAKIWKPLLRLTLHADIAQVEGVPVRVVKGLYMLLMALVFAIAVQLTGVLLITALLVIPAATARQFAKTPHHMAMLASGLGGVSVVLGLGCSWIWDWPAGPAIVVVSSLSFLFSLCWR